MIAVLSLLIVALLFVSAARVATIALNGVGFTTAEADDTRDFVQLLRFGHDGGIIAAQDHTEAEDE